MTTTEEEFDFASGAEGSKELSKSGAQFRKTPFYNMDDGETTIFRFISEHTLPPWDIPVTARTLSVQMHSMVPTKPKPADSKATKWPTTMGAVCRNDRAFRGKYPDCFIDEFMRKADGKAYSASGRTFAIACIREEVKENGRVLGLKDATREIAEVDKDGKPTGVTTVEKKIVVLSQAFKNFWSIMEGFGARYGTITDRDYVITRVGKDQNTTYQIVPLDPIPMLDASGAPIVENGQIVGRSLRIKEDGSYVDPEWAERYKHDWSLPHIISEQASDDYYARFFDTRVQAPPSGGGSQEAPVGPPPPNNDVSDEAMQALMNRVKGQEATASAAAPEQPQQAPDSQQAAPAAAGGMRDFG